MAAGCRAFRIPILDKFSFFPLPDLGRFKVIAQPEGKGKGFWAGGCSSLKDDKVKIWLAYRLRNPEKRGHKVCIAASQDGADFIFLQGREFFYSPLHRLCIFGREISFLL